MRPWPARVVTVVGAFMRLVVALHEAGVSHASRRADAVPGHTTIQSFNQAKNLAREVFAGHEHTFFCDCASRGTTVDLASCGYQPTKQQERATRLEWDPIVPAEAFGQSFQEWREGNAECVDRKGKAFNGRNCARKISVTCRFMEADLYHPQPESAEVNLLRSNDSMAMIPGEAREFGRCDLEIAGRKTEPRPDIRGDIARTDFDMNAAYPGRGIISRQHEPLFDAWDKEDPVDDWERERARRIEHMQGNRNPFVT